VSSGQILFVNDKIADGSELSKDGKYVYAGFDKWNIETGEKDPKHPTGKTHEGGVYSYTVVRSPVTLLDTEGGKYFLSGGFDTTLKLWEPKEFGLISCYLTLQGHTAPILSVALSPDAKSALFGSRDKTVRLWNIESGKELINMSSHKDDVFKVVFSSDGKQALSASLDRSIKLWDVKTGKELVSFISFEDSDDMIILTPDHYFFSTKNASRNIHYVIGMKTFSFDQFDLQYNRPDIVLSRIGKSPQELINSYRAAYIKRLKKMGFNQEKIDKFVNGDFDKGFSAPEIYISRACL